MLLQVFELVFFLGWHIFKIRRVFVNEEQEGRIFQKQSLLLQSIFALVNLKNAHILQSLLT